MGYTPRPMHRVYVCTKLITGFFSVAVCPELPIQGVTMLMGNNLAGGLVVPSLEIVDAPLTGLDTDSVAVGFKLYPAKSSG